jgi:neutral trehalase
MFVLLRLQGSVIPVELNSILYMMEQDLSQFAGILASQLRDTCSSKTLAATSGDTYHIVANQVQAEFCSSFDIPPMCEEIIASGREYAPTISLEPGVTVDGIDDDGVKTLLGRVAVCADMIADSYTAHKSRFSDAASQRAQAMEALMWDKQTSQWRDLRISNDTDLKALFSVSESRTDAHTLKKNTKLVTDHLTSPGNLKYGVNVQMDNITTVSNYVPLFAKLIDFNDTARLAAIVSSLQGSQLLQPGGLATTLANTSQQWDWPNGWAPLQHWIVVGLNGTNYPPAQEFAREIARRWLLSGYIGFENTGYMYEKYDVTNVGQGGGGGEYIPQIGFGWTNGVALDLLVRYNFTDLEAVSA